MARVADFLARQRPEAPTQEVGIGGFTALVRASERYKLTAEAPATPVEDGSFVNDHIILKPITLSIEGSVGDIHLRASPPIRQFQRLQAEIGNVTSQYAPARTQSQLSQVSALANDLADAVRRADAALDAGEQALDFFGNQDEGSKSLQEQFIDAMEALHFGQQVIAIDMPFRRHENMVILSFQANTDNITAETTFTIEAQQLQFAELQFVEVASPAAGLGGQTDPEVSKGTQEGEPVETSLLFEIIS